VPAGALEFFSQNLKHFDKISLPKTYFFKVPARALDFFLQNFKNSDKFSLPKTDFS